MNVSPQEDAKLKGTGKKKGRPSLRQGRRLIHGEQLVYVHVLGDTFQRQTCVSMGPLRQQCWDERAEREGDITSSPHPPKSKTSRKH